MNLCYVMTFKKDSFISKAALHREGEKERTLAFTGYSLGSQWQGLSQAEAKRLESQPSLPTWAVGAQELGPSSATLPAALAGSQIRGGVVGT